MKTKFLLPVLAMIVAIGMSFTTLKSSDDPDTDYIYVDDDFVSLDMELTECQGGPSDCLVQIEEGGPIHFVYDDQDLLTKKPGSGQVIRLWEN